jgi:hypothetical protein
MPKRKVGNFWMIFPKQKSSYLPPINKLYTDEASAKFILDSPDFGWGKNPGKNYECFEVEVRKVKK